MLAASPRMEGDKFSVPQIGASIISGLNAFQKLAYIRMKAEGQ